MDIATKNKNQENIWYQRKVKVVTDLVTKEDVDIVIKRALGSSLKVVDYNVTAFSDEKLGFLGCHRKLTVTVETDITCAKKTHLFFVKSIPYDIETQAELIKGCKAFYKETLFYKAVIPELLRGLKDKSWVAQNYLIKDDLLIFEDLKSKNFQLQGKLLDITHTKSALTGFANLHASSLLAEKRLGKTMLQMYPDLLQENLFARDGVFYSWISSSIELTAAIVKKLGFNNSNIHAYINKIFELVQPSKTRQNVINHGDAKSLNIMFDDSKPIPNCVMVDYQLVRYVPPSFDISQFLYLNLRRELREKHEKELLKHYHDDLVKVVKKHSNELEVFSFSNFLKEYEEFKVAGLITNALYSPINLLEGKMCAEMTKDSEGFEKMLFGNRISFVLEMMEKDSEYNKLLVEIFTELAEKSNQILLS